MPAFSSACAKPKASSPSALIGEKADLTYAYDYLGAGPETLAKIADGSHPFLKKLEGAERPMLIIGQGALARPDGASCWRSPPRPPGHGRDQAGARWNGFNVLHLQPHASAGLDLGFVPGKGGLDVEAMLDAAGRGKIEVVYLLGADEIDMERLGKAFVIYQGSHGDEGAHRADVILPGAAYTEKDGTYVNTEGRAQMTARAVFPPGEAREDWKIVRALSGALGKPLPFDTAQQLRARMYEAHPHLALLDLIDPADAGAIERLAKTQGKCGKERFGRAVDDYYLTNPIARASSIMANLSALHAARERQGDRHRWLSSGRAMVCRLR